jgi:hypothetical protein
MGAWKRWKSQIVRNRNRRQIAWNRIDWQHSASKQSFLRKYGSALIDLAAYSWYL